MGSGEELDRGHDMTAAGFAFDWRRFSADSLSRSQQRYTIMTNTFQIDHDYKREPDREVRSLPSWLLKASKPGSFRKPDEESQMSFVPIQKIVRLVLFLLASACSAIPIAAALRHPFSKALFGLGLVAALIVGVLLACSWYLRFLWRGSGRLAIAMTTRIRKTVSSIQRPQSSSIEEAR